MGRPRILDGLDVAAPVNESVRGRPAEPLRPYVAWYGGYRQAGVEPGRHRGLPSPYLTLIFTLDDPLIIAAHPDLTHGPDSYRTLVGGLHTRPAIITHEGRQSGIQLALHPLGARALLGFPAGEIAGIDLDASLVMGAVATEIHERLRDASTWRERFAVLDALLAARLRPSGAIRPEVIHVWRELVARRGDVGITGLAAEIGWSSRHLSSRFQTEIGLSAKTAARIVRFDRARRALQTWVASGPPRLSELAAACGYYDQAHLARDFRELAGCSPTTWLAEEFRYVQAEDGGEVPGSQT